jgi:hypothetical protein
MNLAAREWKEWMQKLSAFRKRFGHSRVPPNWSGDPRLGKWVSNQRNEFHRLGKDAYDPPSDAPVDSPKTRKSLLD